MKKRIYAIISITALLNTNETFGQFATPATITPNTLNTATGGSVGIGVAAPAAKLEVLNSSNQLRLSNSSTIYSDINSTANGLIFTPSSTANKIAFGIGTTAYGFHSNMGPIRISDPTSTTRGLNIAPNYATANGDVPIGTLISSAMNLNTEGLSFISSGSGAVGVKIGAYAFSPSGWKAMWETANTNIGLPNLLLAKSGGSVAIGLGATNPSQVLDVNGNFSLRGNNIIYNTTDGIINWGNGTTGNLYFRTLTTQGVTSAYTDRMTILNNGNVGVGTITPGAKLEVAGQIKITDGTQLLGRVLTSDANGLASWQTVNGLLSGGTANYIPKWGSANALTTSLIYDDATNVGIGFNAPYKKLSVNGDVSFLSVTGKNDFEIVGNGQIPARRGISVDNDPSGKFNFYVHSWQTNAGFYFKNGLNDNTLVSINGNGRTDINAAIQTNKYLVVNDISIPATPVESFGVYGNGSAYMGKHIEMGYPSVTANISSNSTIGLGIFQNTAGALAAQCTELRNNTSGAINTLLIVDRDDQDAISMNKWTTGGAFVKNFVVKGNGATYIGTKKPFGNHADAMLAVDGKALFKSIYVNTSSAVWADYVFENDYKLLSLTEVEKYYTENKHLPDVPSAKEFEKEGINIAENQAMLMKKIEELTIYIVELEKDVKNLKKKQKNEN